MSSLFRRFLKATTNCGSAIRERSGGSATYVREDTAASSDKDPRELENPKPLAAARLLDARDLNFLLIVWGSMMSGESAHSEWLDKETKMKESLNSRVPNREI